MAWVEEKAVTREPARVVWVVNEEGAVKHIGEVSATHSTARMSRLGVLNHCCGKNADIVGRTSHQFIVNHNIYVVYLLYVHITSRSYGLF